jgi:hypothetical protein
MFSRGLGLIVDLTASRHTSDAIRGSAPTRVKHVGSDLPNEATCRCIVKSMNRSSLSLAGSKHVARTLLNVET